MMKKSFPNLKQMTIRIAAAMGTTYVCESFFSKLNIVETKNRNSLTDENMTNELCCATTKLPVDIKKSGNYIQKQVSHWGAYEENKLQSHYFSCELAQRYIELDMLI